MTNPSLRSALLALSMLTGLLGASGCISAPTPLFDGVKTSLPLPQSAVLYGVQDGEIHASLITREGAQYRWENEGKIAQLRFVSVKANGARNGFFAAEVLEGDKPMYGLIERTNTGLMVYPFDADPFAQKLGIATDNENFSTNFSKSSDLLTVFGHVAAKIPAQSAGEIVVEGVTIAAIAMQILDNSDPLQKAQGEQYLKQAEAQRAAKQ